MSAEPLPPAFLYEHEGAILSVPEGMAPRDIILALRELERLALEDYMRRTADCGGS